MAKLYVTEYIEVAPFGGVAVAVPREPEVTTQVVTFSTSTQSSAFSGKTRIVRIHTDAICCIAFGTNPTAVITTHRRLAANQTEYFAVPAGQSYMVAAVTTT